MLLSVVKLLALVVAALSLSGSSAHVMEMPQKMKYDPQMYAAVNGTLYHYFAVVGGPYQIGGIILSGWLAYLGRGHAWFGWSLAAAILLALSFVVWLAVVMPVNSQIAESMRNNAAQVPDMWMRLKGRWEYGHLGIFVVHLLGFVALAWAVIRSS